MAIEATFEELLTRSRTLRDALASLQLTVVEDRPLRNDVILVERLGNAVDDLRGWAEEGLAGAANALAAVGNRFDGYQARRALASCNASFIRLEYRFFSDEMSCEQLEELARYGQRRGREWKSWVSSVIASLGQCRDLLRELDRAFLSAWQELAERLGNAGISVHASSVGQQISAPIRDGATREVTA